MRRSVQGFPFSIKKLYSVLFYALTPLILGRLAWRARKSPAYRQRWPERFACYPTTPRPGVIWFHAVSVGETEAAFPLIRRVLNHVPEVKVLVTTTTPTGSARVRAVLGDQVQHVYLPYDLPGSVNRFLKSFRPVLGIILETEIWPNLFLGCAYHGVPVVIVNGRLSEKSARGYRRVGTLIRESLSAVSLIAAQTADDKERYITIGADPDRVTVTGNIKFDLDFPESLRRQAEDLRVGLFNGCPVWIAGSTHAGEDQQLLSVHTEIRREIPGLLLILAPRHPERFGDVAELCIRSGHTVRRRSEGRPCDSDTSVLLLDSLGELKLFYAASDLAFVGGSLVPKGGHNVLEPAAAGIPVLFGPHMFNFAEIVHHLRLNGGGIEVTNLQELATRIAELLKHSDRRMEIGTKARDFVAVNGGALDRTLELLAEWLPPLQVNSRTAAG
jgi:3-deoxy-D-manno-octulosonic-acid transferase